MHPDDAQEGPPEAGVSKDAIGWRARHL